MNILVTGANGQLGNEMRIVSKNTTDHYLFTDVNQVEGVETTYLDITDMDAIRKMVSENHIDAIINCAAWTNVDACENDEKLAALAEKLNADAPENLALAMKETGGLLVQISTDYVFGKEPYNVPCGPQQKGTPTGVYGTTKLHGEQKIMASGCQYVIIRTAWLYSEFGKNFCKTMLNLTATKPQLKVVFDQCGTPTYALDLANAILTVIDKIKSADDKSKYTGIYHFSNVLLVRLHTDDSPHSRTHTVRHTALLQFGISFASGPSCLLRARQANHQGNLRRESALLD